MKQKRPIESRYTRNKDQSIKKLRKTANFGELSKIRSERQQALKDRQGRADAREVRAKERQKEELKAIITQRTLEIEAHKKNIQDSNDSVRESNKKIRELTQEIRNIERDMFKIR